VAAGTRREKPAGMRMLLAFTLLAACGHTVEQESHRKGAFDVADIVAASSEEVRIAVDREGVPLEKMPMERWLAGLPMRGLANVKIDLAAPMVADRTMFSRAHGSFTFTCDHDCKLGDDTARLALGPTQLDVGHLDLASFAVRGEVANGHATLTEWKVVSPDVKVTVDVDVELADDLLASTVEGCIRFAPVAGLEKRRPKTWAVVQTTGARPDETGMFSIRITGTLGAPKRLAQACDRRVAKLLL
jgi:hypothetical protein